MYESVPVGGIVIFDVVSTHKDVQRFWTDFKHEQGLNEGLVPIDGNSKWFRKERAFTIDWTYFGPPKDVNKYNQVWRICVPGKRTDKYRKKKDTASCMDRIDKL